MTRRRKPLRPRTSWRYGAHSDEPLFILEDHSDGTLREHFVEFVVPITHEKFTVRIRGTYHHFAFGNFHARKVVINENRWISRVAYQSLVILADHAMRAHFASFGTYHKPSARPLYVENERVTIALLSRSEVRVRWSNATYQFTPSVGWVCLDPDAGPLIPPLCRFFERFFSEISPKLPVYRTPEEKEADLVERRLQKTVPASLFSEEEVVSVRIRKAPKYCPKQEGPTQPRLI